MEVDKSGSLNFREKSQPGAWIVWQSQGGMGHHAECPAMALAFPTFVTYSISTAFVLQPLNTDPTLAKSSPLHLERGTSPQGESSPIGTGF